MLNNNYSAIHYEEFQPLLDITGNTRKALLLDKVVYWFKVSRFTLPRSGSNDIWFTRTYAQMHQETKIPISTLKSYMKEFVDKGLIERVQKKVGIAVRAYFRATEQLLNKLRVGQSKTPTTQRPRKNLVPDKKNFEQSCTIKNTKTVLSINKDQKVNIVNNITCSHVSKKQGKLFNLPVKVQQLFDEVGERLEEEQKASIWGVIINLQKQDNLSFNPVEIAAWFSFSIIHADHQLKGIKGFKKCLSTLAVKMREGRYQKPVGFHNHWDIGVQMRKSDAKQRKKLQQDKIAGVLEARKSPANGFEKQSSEKAIKLRMAKSPDGDFVFERSNKVQSFSKELRSLKCEKNKVIRLISWTTNEINSQESMLSIEKKGLCDILKGTFLSKRLVSDHQKDSVRRKIDKQKVELAQYQQALSEINGKIAEAEANNAVDILPALKRRGFPRH